MASTQKTKGHNIDEDVDDLDDLIDQFSPPPARTTKSNADQTHSASIPTKQSVQETSTSAQSSSSPFVSSDVFSDDFTKEFAKGMESLLNEIGKDHMLDSDPEVMDEEREKTFKAAWENLFMETMSGVQTDAAQSQPSSSTEPPQQDAAPDSFQGRIKQTMDKLKETESTLKATGSNPDLESLLGQLDNMTEGAETEDDLQRMLESMMSQLMSKEVLYEPLKELHDKFPSYLTDNASKLSEADRNRYQSQQECVVKIVAVFEDSKYSDDNPETGLQIVTLMNEMQQYGAPPIEIMGELPPGMNLGADGLPQLPEGCLVM